MLNNTYLGLKEISIVKVYAELHDMTRSGTGNIEPTICSLLNT